MSARRCGEADSRGAGGPVGATRAERPVPNDLLLDRAGHVHAASGARAARRGRLGARAALRRVAHGTAEARIPRERSLAGSAEPRCDRSGGDWRVRAAHRAQAHRRPLPGPVGWDTQIGSNPASCSRSASRAVRGAHRSMVRRVADIAPRSASRRPTFSPRRRLAFGVDSAIKPLESGRRTQRAADAPPVRSVRVRGGPRGGSPPEHPARRQHVRSGSPRRPHPTDRRGPVGTGVRSHGFDVPPPRIPRSRDASARASDGPTGAGGQHSVRGHEVPARRDAERGRVRCRASEELGRSPTPPLGARLPPCEIFHMRGSTVKIAVCIKRVPGNGVRFKIAPNGTGVDETGLKFDMSDFDGYAVEAALQINEKLGAGEVVVIRWGPTVQETLRKALSMGAERAIQLKADRCRSTASRSQALAAELKDGGYDLVLFGRCRSTPPPGRRPHDRRAARLAVRHRGFQARDRRREGHGTRELEGAAELVEFPLPAVVTIDEGVARPRYPVAQGDHGGEEEAARGEAGAARRRPAHGETLALPPERPAGRIIGEGAVRCPSWCDSSRPRRRCSDGETFSYSPNRAAESFARSRSRQSPPRGARDRGRWRSARAGRGRPALRARPSSASTAPMSCRRRARGARQLRSRVPRGHGRRARQGGWIPRRGVLAPRRAGTSRRASRRSSECRSPPT